MLVSSPFTGVFFDPGDHVWRSLTPQLPHPLTEASFVGVGPVARDGIASAFIATSGRGLFRVDQPGNAAMATYFAQPKSRIVPQLGGQLAALGILMASDGTTSKKAPVTVRILDTSHRLLYSTSSYRDSQGRVLVPFWKVADGNLVHLYFQGDSSVASSQTRFVYSNAP